MLCLATRARIFSKRAFCSATGISRGRADGLGEALDVVRVQHQGLLQLAGGPRELRQQQDAAVVAGGGDELRGHQVHAVVQGADNAKVGQRGEGDEGVEVLVALEQDHRAPVGRGQAGVQGLAAPLDVGHHILVVLQVRPRGHADLDVAEAAPPAGVEVEEALQGLQALGDALGVVEAVHAQAQLEALQAVLPPQALAGLGHLVALGLAVDGLKIDGDGIGPHAGAVGAALDLLTVPVQVALQLLADGVHEVVRVVAQVEAQDVVAQEAVQQFLLVRADAEDLGAGPGDVPKKYAGQVRAALLQQAAHQRQVIVLQEDHRALGTFGGDGLGELGVHPPVAVPIPQMEFGADITDVREGPEGFVREALVVAAFFLARQGHAAQGVGGAAGRHADAVLGVGDAEVGVAAAVADPGGGASGSHGVQGDGQPPRRADAGYAALLPHMDIGLAVGGQHQLAAVEAAFHQVPQALA